MQVLQFFWIPSIPSSGLAETLIQKVFRHLLESKCNNKGEKSYLCGTTMHESVRNHDGCGSGRTVRFPRRKTRWRGKGKVFLNNSQGYFGHCITQMRVYNIVRECRKKQPSSWLWMEIVGCHPISNRTN